MILVDKEEIVKISSYVPCRIHGSEQVDFFPIRERRENMRQYAALDLPCCYQFLCQTLFLFEQIFLFHLLPLHPADCIHLMVQGDAGPVDLLLHDLKFPD